MFSNLSSRVLFNINRGGKLTSRSSTRVSARSPSNKRADRRCSTKNQPQNQQNAEEGLFRTVSDPSMDSLPTMSKSINRWIIGGAVVAALGLSASWNINHIYKSSIEDAIKGDSVSSNIAVVNKLNKIVPNKVARLHYFTSPELVATLVNIVNQPDTTETRGAKVEAIKLLSSICDVKSSEALVLQQLDLAQFLRNFMRDPQSNNGNIEEPVVLKSKIDWVNQTNKVFPESNESLATVSHKFLAKIAANTKTHDAFVQSGYIPYLAVLLKSNDNNSRRIAVDTIAQLTYSANVRVELAKTDVFRTLNNYLYENDDLKTLRPDGKDETRATILNAKLAMRQMYLSATALYYLKNSTSDWDQLITYAKHKEITAFNYSDEVLAGNIWQQSRMLLTGAGLGLVWGTLCKRLARPSRRHGQFIRKGGIPAALGAASLIGFYQIYLYFEGQAIRTATHPFNPLTYDAVRMGMALPMLYLAIGLPLTPYALLPAVVSIDRSSQWEEGYYRLVKKLQLL